MRKVTGVVDEAVGAAAREEGAKLVFEARHEIRQYVSGLYDRLCNVREVTRLRANLAAERARADRLAVELATLRGMNHMCTALANRVGAYNS